MFLLTCLLLLLHHHHFLLIANLFSSAFSGLKIDAVLGSNYPSCSQLPFQCIFFLKCLQLMALPQIACLAKVLAQHVFLPQACHLQWSLTSLQNTFYLHLHMSAKSCPSFALCILIKAFSPWNNHNLQGIGQKMQRRN